MCGCCGKECNTCKQTCYRFEEHFDCCEKDSKCKWKSRYVFECAILKTWHARSIRTSWIMGLLNTLASRGRAYQCRCWGRLTALKTTTPQRSGQNTLDLLSFFILIVVRHSTSTTDMSGEYRSCLNDSFATSRYRFALLCSWISRMSVKIDLGTSTTLSRM